MQNTRKKQLSDFLTELKQHFTTATALAAPLLNAVNENWSNAQAQTQALVINSDVFVPVVGSFSTGKSTALNSLMGRSILPEKVSPETAIPAELRFAEDEHIMALSVAGEWSRYGINDLAALSADAAQYQLVKVFANAEYLKQIEPLVLVDMPGFDSGLDQHNKAIMRYITSGALYLYMVNAKAGTVTKQDVRRIEEILDLGRTVKIVLTMTDLAAPTDISATQQYISSYMSTVTGDEQISLINKDDTTALQTLLAQANVPALFDNLVLGAVRDLFFDASNHINTAIKALTSSTENITKQTQAAEASLTSIEMEQQRMLMQLQQGELTAKAEQVMQTLDNTLHSALDELVVQARGGEAMLSRGIADLVRAKLTVQIQQLVRRFTNDVAYQFSGSVTLDGMSLTQNNSGWITDLIASVETEAMNALAGFGQTVGDKKVFSNALVNGLSGIAIAIPHPVLRVAFAILPGIIGSLFNSFMDKNQAEQYRQIILSQVIPAVMSQLRPQVESSLDAVQQEIIKRLSGQISAKVDAQRLIYNDLTSATSDDLARMQQSVEQLKQLRAELTLCAEGVIG